VTVHLSGINGARICYCIADTHIALIAWTNGYSAASASPVLATFTSRTERRVITIFSVFGIRVFRALVEFFIAHAFIALIALG